MTAGPLSSGGARPLQAALYARVSSDPLGDLSSVTRQLVDLRQLVTLRGDVVAREFVDDNESAFRRPKPRPAFTALQEFVRTGQAHAIYVWHPDRLYRSLRDLEDIVDLVEEHDVMVCTVRAGLFDLSTATGRLVARLVGATARYESEHKGERLSRRFAEDAARGAPPSNAKGFGYLPGLQAHNQLEAEALRTAAQLILSGNPLVDAAKAVSRALGYIMPAWALRNALIAHRTAGLRNYLTTAERRRGVTTGTVTQGTWPPILDYSTWLQVRSLLERTGTGRGHTRHAEHLLTRLLVCGICGNPMMSAGRNYACPPAWNGCQKITISKTNIEPYLVEWAHHPSHPRRLHTRLAEIETLAEATGRYRDVDTRRNELAALYGHGHITAAEWATARDQLARQTHLPDLLDVPTLREHDLLTRSLHVLRHWDAATVAEQRTTLGALLGSRRAVIAPRGKGSGFDPSRISIEEPDPRHAPEQPTATPGSSAPVTGHGVGHSTQISAFGGDQTGLSAVDQAALVDSDPLAGGGLDLEREQLLRTISVIDAHRRSAATAISTAIAAEHAREANRLILQLHDTGTTGAEIGRLLGITREAVRQRLNTARQQQREAVEARRAPRPKPAPRARELMAPGEAAHELGLTYATLQRLARDGHIDYIKSPGGHPRYVRASVTAWREQHPPPPVRPAGLPPRNPATPPAMRHADGEGLP